MEESLEKAAHKMLMDFGIMSVGESINVLNVKKLMVLFAKEQQERSYSEEDMRKAFIAGGNSNITEDDGYGSIYLKYMDKWFEQFKKK
jgi:hypothetical protein